MLAYLKAKFTDPSSPMPWWHALAIRAFLSVSAVCVLIGLLLWVPAGWPAAVAHHGSGIALIINTAAMLLSWFYLFGLIFTKHRIAVYSHTALVWPLVGLLGFQMLAASLLAVLHKRIETEANMLLQISAGVVRLEGAVGESFPRRIAELPQSQLLTRLELVENGGGLVQEMLAAEIELKRRGVQTVVVDGTCASSCALLAMLFPNRLMTEHSRLGFHDVRDAGGERANAWKARKDVTNRLVSAGYSPQLVDVLLSSDRMAWRTRDQSLATGLATGCWDAAAAAQVPCPSQTDLR